VSHPDGLPDLFLDRSLGRIQVPGLLRSEGLRLVTLAEHYGIPADEDVVDEEWLELAGRSGWAVFHKDARIRSRTIELQTVKRFSVRCFCITRQDLTARQMAERYLRHLEAITMACSDTGPFIYAVHETRIERLDLER
jgi:PIN like domain